MADCQSYISFTLQGRRRRQKLGGISLKVRSTLSGVFCGLGGLRRVAGVSVAYSLPFLMTGKLEFPLGGYWPDQVFLYQESHGLTGNQLWGGMTWPIVCRMVSGSLWVCCQVVGAVFVDSQLDHHP